jgi:hypothetical protein
MPAVLITHYTMMKMTMRGSRKMRIAVDVVMMMSLRTPCAHGHCPRRRSKTMQRSKAQNKAQNVAHN